MKYQPPVKYEVIRNGWNEHTEVTGIQYLFEFAEDHDGYADPNRNILFEERYLLNQDEIVEIEPFWDAVWDETKKAVTSVFRREPCYKCGSIECKDLSCKVQ